MTEAKQFSTRLLNEQGDILLVWKDDEDTSILETIRAKMQEGFTFFIVEPRAFGLLAPNKVEVKNVDQDRERILKHRTVEIKDADFSTLQQAGKVTAQVAPPDGPIKAKRRAATPEEVVKNDTVAVKPRRGG